jgi:2,3-bisphosphoglycerate-dependent phosphoglycerate mutase
MSSPAEDAAPTRLVMIRHGESRVTVDRVIGGPRTCSGLSELGGRQVERLRDRLAETGELEATVLYASSYARAIETAEMIAPVLGV